MRTRFGSLSLNLSNGQLTASCTVDGTTINVSGQVRCVESMLGQPSDRFLFVSEERTSGFYVSTTTNIYAPAPSDRSGATGF